MFRHFLAIIVVLLLNTSQKIAENGRNKQEIYHMFAHYYAIGAVV